MKNGNWISLIATAAALFVCSLSGTASAQPFGSWVGTPIKGHAAVSSGTTVYALGNTWGANGGWQVQTYNFQHPTLSPPSLEAWGTSIAVDTSGSVWVAQPDGRIKTVTGPTSIGGPGCGGEFVLVRHELGHNNLAMAGFSQPSIIDRFGRVYSWKASNSCWNLLPNFPSGVVANDLGTGVLGVLRAADANGRVWQFNASNSTWTEIAGGGQLKGLGFSGAGTSNTNTATWGIGFDNWTIWNWNGNGWSQPANSATDWNHWQIFQLGSSRYTVQVGFTVTAVATALDGTVWAFGGAL